MAERVIVPKYESIFAKRPEMIPFAKDRWEFAKSHLRRHGAWNKHTASVADRYARAYAEYEVLYPEAVEKGPSSFAEKGEYANMKWAGVRRLSDQITKYERLLGMNFSRKKKEGMRDAAEELDDFDEDDEDDETPVKSKKTGADRYLD